MEASYTITEADYVSAMRLYQRITPKHGLIYALVAALMLAVAFIGPPVVRDGTLGVLGGAVTAVVFGRLVLMPWVAKRNFQKYKAIQTPITLRLRDEGIHFSTSDGAGLVTWDKVLKWRKNHRYLLIYLMPRLYHIVPARVAESGFDLARLCGALEENVGAES